MSQQKNQYFKTLKNINSPRSQLISSVLTSQQFQKICSQPNFELGAPNSQQKIKTPQKKKRILTLCTKVKTEPSSDRQTHLFRNCQISSLNNPQDQVIKTLLDEINKLKQKRNSLERKKNDIQDQIKRLKIEKQIAKTIRMQQQLFRQIQQQKGLKIQRLEKQDKQRNCKLNKLDAIKNRLQKLQQQKQQRQQILSSRSVVSLPKYKFMEKRFLMQQLKEELNKKVDSKKLHEYRYKNYLQHHQKCSSERNIIKRVKTQISTDKKNEAKQLQERRKQMMFLLEEKRKHNQLKINPQLSHQFQIARDKTQNPQKYHFLKMKNLTDEQIFKDFKDFQMNFDNRQLGNKYMVQSKLYFKKSNDIKQTRQKERQNQNKQKNNSKGRNSNVNLTGPNKFSLNHKSQSISMNKTSQINNHKKQICKILRGSESKSKILQLLSQQSLSNSKIIKQLQSQLLRPREYSECLKIQNSIDNEYLQFLKSKIVSLGLQLQ